MKKTTAFLLIICMILCQYIPAAADDKNNGTTFLFGDEWAASWGEELKGFFYNEGDFKNTAYPGALLSQITKKSEFSEIKKGDVVILSYGVLEKDRPGDKNAEFKKILEKVTGEITSKGATVIFASICSTMRFNTVTGQMAESRNFYTETTRSFAKEKGIEYVDLALLTAKCATKMGFGSVAAVYRSNMALTNEANRMCAYEVFKSLCKINALKGKLKNNLSRVYTVGEGESFKAFDMFFEKALTESYMVRIRGGRDVYINDVNYGNGSFSKAVESAEGKINVRFSACEAIEVTPIYVFNASGFATTDEKYTSTMLPGCYDVTVKKTEPLKASVYLNDYLVASNLDMPGTQKVENAAEHTFNEFRLDGGKFEVYVKGLTDKLEFISFCEAATIFDEKIRIFIGGDSTVCNYYPLLRDGNERDGEVMTGWGMMMEKYVDADVMNLAASGDWAANWLKHSFPIVEKEGEKGDIFIVQFGINDHDKSTVHEMKNALNDMIDRCVKKGIIPILVSPQISAGYGWGNESNVGKSDGGAYVEFFDAVRNLAAEKGCFYVDLTDLSSGWFSEVGRDNVYKKYHLWDYEKDAPKDMMHLSFKGADAMCRFFVMGIKNIAEANKCDAWGNTLSLLKFW